MIKIHSINTIVSDPKRKNGQPIVSGTNIRVVDVVASFIYRGLSPEELSESFRLTLGQVYAVLAYYYDHKADVDAWFDKYDEEVEALKQELEKQGKLMHLD